MRLRVELVLEGGDSLKLPVQYNQLVQGMIYANLDRALADWLHEEGHTHGLRRFKLFTFSRIYGLDHWAVGEQPQRHELKPQNRGLYRPVKPGGTASKLLLGGELIETKNGEER